MQQITVGTDGYLTQGESFEWVTPGDKDCDVTHCSPPLVSPHYHVKAGVSTPAQVSGDAPKKKHPYNHKCGSGSSPQINPHLIIS
jgi:hypothetical protein